MNPKNPSESTKRPQESAILECPSCYSHRAIILNADRPRARCADCSKTYSIHYEKPVGSLALTDNKEDQEELAKTHNRKTKADYRAEITPAPLPKIPFNTTIVEEAIASGPTGVRQSQRLALRHARKFMVDLEQQWTLDTPLLGSLRDSCD